MSVERTWVEENGKVNVQIGGDPLVFEMVGGKLVTELTDSDKVTYKLYLKKQ